MAPFSDNTYSSNFTPVRGKENISGKGTVTGWNTISFPGEHTLRIRAHHGNIRVCGNLIWEALKNADSGSVGPFMLHLDKKDGSLTFRVTGEKYGDISFFMPPSYPAEFFIEDLDTGEAWTTRTWNLEVGIGRKREIEITRSDYPSSRGHGGRPVVLYGCPTADEAEGAVPEAMLAEFEGFEDVEF